MSLPSKVRALLALLVIALAAAACGSAPAEEGVSAGAEAPAAEEEAAAAEATDPSEPAGAGEPSDADEPAEGDAEPLVMGIPPGEESAEILRRFEPVVALFEEITGREVEPQVAADYLGVVEAMRGGFVDIALFSPFATVIGLESAPIELLLVGEGADEPASVIITRADSDIESLEDLAGRSVAFVDPVSATGMFMPRSLLVAEAGLEADVDYEITYAGGHDSAALAVASGSIDAAGVNYGIYYRLIEEGVIDGDELRVLAETGPIPVGVTFVAREGLDPEVRDAIVEELPARWGDDPAITEVLGEGALAPPTDADLQVLAEVITNLGISLEDIR